MPITHRTMTLDDLERVLGWAADEGWNPGRDDAAAFLAADPEGFFLALDGAEPVAAISVVNHGPDFAFLGLYLCRPGRRGEGIAYALWQHALEHAGARTVGLDGVPDQQANYARSGFELASATSRYSGHLDPVAARSDIAPAEPGMIEAMIALEAHTSGVPKPAYLGAWFTDAASRRSYVLRGDGGLAGLVTVRACRTGAKIGPLIAPDAEAALALMQQAAAAFGPDLIIDVPSTSPGLTALVQERGFVSGFDTARMYRGPAPATPPDWTAVTTLELG